VIQPAGHITTYGYDARSLRTSTIDPDGGRFTYSYNPEGQLATLENPQAQVTTYSYDARQRRTSIAQANGTNTSFSYDAVSRLSEVAHSKSDTSIVNRPSSAPRARLG